MFRLTDAELKKAIHDGGQLPIGEAYALLLQRQIEKVARLLKSGATLTELEKEAK